MPAFTWKKSYRIIRTVYPPVDLFEDVADPADWDLLVSAEAKLNPRVRDEAGDLTLVPPHRRIAGPTASMAMAPFTHASTARPSRFSDGTYGVYYCGETWEVALAETAHHFERFMRATNEPPADADYRELICGIAGNFLDIRQNAAYADCQAPDSWSASQTLGRTLHANDGDGIIYTSVRWPAASAAAVFWPNLLRLPIIQARQFRYRWDCSRMTQYFVHGEADRVWHAWP
jgi:hypothetical protein